MIIKKSQKDLKRSKRSCGVIYITVKHWKTFQTHLFLTLHELLHFQAWLPQHHSVVKVLKTIFAGQRVLALHWAAEESMGSICWSEIMAQTIGWIAKQKNSASLLLLNHWPSKILEALANLLASISMLKIKMVSVYALNWNGDRRSNIVPNPPKGKKTTPEDLVRTVN